MNTGFNINSCCLFIVLLNVLGSHVFLLDMADMARVLLAYHFGGIYMDLDFYCHRPFRCLLSHVKEHLYTLEEKALINGGHSYQPPRHILVVATEPLAHAVIFRNKTRVVIQVCTVSLLTHEI